MKFCLTLVLSIFTFFNVIAADSFDDFKNQNMGDFQSSQDEFDTYKAEMEAEFEKYKKIIDEEFAAYKNEIAKNWDTTEVSTNKKWVEYLNNYKIKKVVDFEKREIKVEIIGGSAEDIKPVLKDLVNEDRADAFRRDPVSFNTEKKIKKALPNVETEKVKADPVITNILTNKDKLTDKELDKVSDKLMGMSQVKTSVSSKTGNPIVSAIIKLPEDIYKNAASKVKPHVADYAKQFDLDTSLIMAVIYTESRFNPMAKSYVPAYGLMQIVPKSAGIDAIHFLEGKKRILAPSYLYNAENNVKIGSAYLHILYYKYFAKVKNPESKLYCAIAAYNTGAGNVAYAFNKKTGGRYNLTKAIPVINSMTPRQVYNTLKSNLRYDEAKHYLANVSSKMKDY